MTYFLISYNVSIVCTYVLINEMLYKYCTIKDLTRPTFPSSVRPSNHVLRCVLGRKSSKSDSDIRNILAQLMWFSAGGSLQSTRY